MTLSVVYLPDAQAAIYGVALSVDAFIVNGIPYGVLQRAGFHGFLEKTAGNLQRDIAELEDHVPHVPVPSQTDVMESLEALKVSCRQLIDAVTELRSFRDLPLQEVRSKVGRIPLLRADCVQRIQELEGYHRTPKPFYPSRPAHSTAMVNDFLANLERLFVDEWHASPENGVQRELSPAEDSESPDKKGA